jgi:hypothetical protein
MLQGMTFGFADELDAGLAAAGEAAKGALQGKPIGETFSQAYDTGLQERRAAMEAYGREKPVGSTIAELGGALMMPLGAAGGARSAAAAILKGSGLGAGSGALYGFGSGEGADDRTERAAIGGAVGGVVGGALPLGQALWRGANIKSPRAAKGTGRAMIAEALADEGLTGSQAADKIAAANAAGKTGVTPMDVVQDGRLMGLADDVVQSPNPAQAPLKRLLSERQAGVKSPDGSTVLKGQYERLADDLGELSGVGKNRTVGVMQKIAERRKADAAPAFEAAFKFDAASSRPTQQAFVDLMNTDAGPLAYKRAVKIAKNEMPAYRPPTPKELVGEDGRLAAMPDARFLHFMKMGLDDLYSSAARGESGMGQTVAHSIKGVRNRFRDTLKAENPAYAQAMDKFAGEMALADAVDAGKEFIVKPADELAEAMQGMGTTELEHFRIGALTRITDQLAKKVSGPTADFARQLASEDYRAKLLLLMPDDAARQTWLKRLEVERGFSTTAQIQGNSATSRRRELAEQMEGGALEGGMLSTVAQGVSQGPQSMILAALGKVYKPVQDWAKRQRRAAVGGMLSQTDKTAEAFLRGLDTRPPTIGYGSPRLAPAAAIGLGQQLLPAPPSPEPPIPYRR